MRNFSKSRTLNAKPLLAVFALAALPWVCPNPAAAEDAAKPEIRLEASSLSGDAGATIARWEDKTGKGRNAVAYSDEKSSKMLPTLLQKATPNGQSALHFQNAGLIVSPMDYKEAKAITLLFVARVNGAPGWGGIAGTGGEGICLQTYPDSKNLRARGHADIRSETEIVGQGWQVFAIRAEINGDKPLTEFTAVGQKVVRQSSHNINTEEYSAGHVNKDTAFHIGNIGHWFGGMHFPGDCDIAAVVMYSSLLSEADLDKEIQDLHSRYLGGACPALR